MFAGLRHHAVIRRDYQQHQINALRAGEHVMGEFFMARHIDKTAKPGTRLQLGIQITEVDGHATFAFLRAAVAGLPGQRLQQRGFAVVDVPCRADDHCATCNSGNCASHAGSSSSWRRSSHNASSSMRPSTGMGKARSAASRLSK